MSYTEELKELKRQQLVQRVFSSDVLDNYSPFMTDDAKRENQRRSQMMLDIYDYKIAQIEPLAQNEQKEQIVNAVINAVSNQDNYISGTLEKSLQKVLQSLNFE